MITVCHHSASLVKPKSDPRDGFFYPILTLLIDSYILQQEEEAETPVPSENRFERELTEKSLVSQVSSKQLSDLEQRPPSTPRQVKPTKPITKLISKAPAPPSPPKAKTPEPLRTPPKTKLGPPPQKESARARTPTPPPPRPITPLPGFITQFKGVDWFDKFFPNCNESVS